MIICNSYGLILTLLWAYLFLSAPVLAQVLGSVQSYNKQDFFITYHDDQGIIYPVADRAGRELATFVIRKGLADSREEYISLEAAAWPGFFLRHQNQLLKLQQKTDDKLFLEDATFRLVSGLATSAQDWCSLESFNYPGFFIRHKDSQLWLEEADGSGIFTLDATFRFITPLWDGKNKTVKKKSLIHKTAGNRDESVFIILGILGFIYISLNLAAIIKQKKAQFSVLETKTSSQASDRKFPGAVTECKAEESIKPE